MAKIILKSPYLKPIAQKHLANYARYIATREGVEKPVDTKLQLRMTAFRKKVITELLEAYPDSKDLFEYQDYLASPTRENADEFILRVAESHGELFGTRQKYVDYIATRPKVAKLAEHGLFTDEGVPVILSQASHEVSEHQGNVWTHIISLRREDAERLGYNSVEQWQKLLWANRNVIAENMKIKPQNFRWYAAFHNADHHPHVHMMAFSTNPDEAYLSKEGIQRIKAALAKDIFRQDNISIYEKQTEYRDALRRDSARLAADAVRKINSGEYDNPLVEDGMRRLADRLNGLSGKKVYGYLSPNDKTLVNRIVDGLATDKNIVRLYNLWYEQREAVLKTYTDHLPERLPLSQNDDFKTFRNAVIREALQLYSPSVTLEDEDMEDDTPVPPADTIVEESADEPSIQTAPDSIFPDELELPDQQDSYVQWKDEYKEARRYWYGVAGAEANFGKAHALILAEAEKGNAFAQHDLGKMLLDGIGCDKDDPAAQGWFTKAFKGFTAAEYEQEKNDYIQYRLGKMCAFGYGTDQSYEAAADWYQKAVDQGNPFAAYSLGSLYTRGQGVAQNDEKAFSLYEMAADDHKRPNAYAMYELGRMCKEGKGTAPDAAQSARWFAKAYRHFVSMEADRPDDRLQYRLGQMNLTGTGTPVDFDAAREYFEKSSALKNTDALYGLAQLYLKKEYSGYDVQKAVGYLIEAARQGHAFAQYKLGKLFLKGEGVVQDVLYGLRWLEEAAKQKNASAEYLLGREYLKGETLQKDAEKAVRYLSGAVAQGNECAAYVLGKAYLHGTDVPRDLDKAVKLLTTSADKGFEAAEYVLGKLYLKDEIVAKDIPKAIAYLEKAAAKGNPFAQYTLGKLYFTGEDVPEDMEKAIRWFTASADQGNMYAQYALGKIYLYGKGVNRDRAKAIALLTAATEQGNPFAAQLLAAVRSNRDWGIATASIRLLRRIGRIFQNKLTVERKGRLAMTDRKLLRQIDEKKMAHGLKL